MGITKVVLVPTALLFGSFLSVKNKAEVPIAVRGALLQASAVGLTAAVCSHPAINYTALFGKSEQGRFPLWSHLLFYPYLYALRGYVLLRRLKNREPVFTEVAEGLYVGGWPLRGEEVPPGSPAVVDCTCELPRSACISALPYLNVPTWDSRGPRLQDIRTAVDWASEKRAQGRPVFVHCAFGHGRSVAVMCALLMALGLAQTWQDGEHMMKQLRPRVRLNNGQITSLQNWTTQNPPPSPSPTSS